MAQELTTSKQQIATVRDLLERSRKQIAMALPRHMTADRMLRIAMTSIQRNPRLLDCTPTSLIGAIIQSAQLGLEPDDVRGEAYLVPFNNRKKNCVEVQLIPGYKGLMDLVARSNRARISPPQAVYENDKFDYEYGLNPKLTHKPAAGDRGKLKCVYAVVRYANGQADFRVMDLEEIEKHRKMSRAPAGGPWDTHYDDMCLKTVVRVLQKFCPSSPELQTAIALDERAEAGIPQDLDALVPEPEQIEPPKPSKLDKLSETLKQQQSGAPEALPQSSTAIPPAEPKPETKPPSRSHPIAPEITLESLRAWLKAAPDDEVLNIRNHIGVHFQKLPAPEQQIIVAEWNTRRQEIVKEMQG